jgi:hypothetical protein
MKEGEE